MFKKFSLIFILILSGRIYADFESLCHEFGGTLKKGHKCPNTSFPLLTPVCFFKNEYGEEHFTDGCTGPSGGHNDLFLKSCVKHDLCYHHEPLSSGKTQKQCDLEFKDNILRDCLDAPDRSKCERWANVMYKSLRAFGGLAYRCDNDFVKDYYQYL
ncbi:MAG: hypothetical protein K9K67_12770 [Bacteriovoracaceae bacterium]|nr:hypothetical protein [Bacteriovoracaceae bacterium]